MANNLVKGLGAGKMEWAEDFVLTDTDQSTALFTVAKSSGAVTMAGAVTMSANPTISGTAPQIVLSDTTASAKDLEISVDGDKAQLKEDAGGAGSLLVLDLANNRVGVATASPSVPLEVTGASSLNGAVVANEAGADVDFRVEGDTGTHLLFCDASADKVGILNNAPAKALDVTGEIQASSHVTVGGSLIVATQTPASAAAAGTAGTIAWDADYLYVCTATNTWKRVAIATWP